MRALLIASGLALSGTGAWLASSPRVEESPPQSQQRQLDHDSARAAPKGVPPAGLPASFRVSFQTSAGENISTLAVYGWLVDAPEPMHVWSSPPVRHTVDHLALYDSVLGPRLIEYPVSVIYYPNLRYFVLRLGTANAYVDSWPTVGNGFNLPFGDFSCGAIRYSAISVMP